MAEKKVPLSERALLKRINRKLKKDHEMVKKCRGDRWRHELGDLYAVDLYRNVIVVKNIDLEDEAKKLGVIQPWERLET